MTPALGGFAVAGDAAPAWDRAMTDVMSALRSAFTTVPERTASRAQRRTWLDTFDWRLYRAGLRLEYVAGELRLAGAASAASATGATTFTRGGDMTAPGATTGGGIATGGAVAPGEKPGSTGGTGGARNARGGEGASPAGQHCTSRQDSGGGENTKPPHDVAIHEKTSITVTRRDLTCYLNQRTQVAIRASGVTRQWIDQKDNRMAQCFPSGSRSDYRRCGWSAVSSWISWYRST